MLHWLLTDPKPKTDDSSAEQAMQIEEVTQAEAEATSAHKEEEHRANSNSPVKTESPGIMQSMIDTAKTILGGKTDEVCSTAVIFNPCMLGGQMLTVNVCMLH